MENGHWTNRCIITKNANYIENGALNAMRLHYAIQLIRDSIATQDYIFEKTLTQIQMQIFCNFIQEPKYNLLQKHEFSNVYSTLQFLPTLCLLLGYVNYPYNLPINDKIALIHIFAMLETEQFEILMTKKLVQTATYRVTYLVSTFSKLWILNHKSFPCIHCQVLRPTYYDVDAFYDIHERENANMQNWLVLACLERMRCSDAIPPVLPTIRRSF